MQPVADSVSTRAATATGPHGIATSWSATPATARTTPIGGRQDPVPAREGDRHEERREPEQPQVVPGREPHRHEQPRPVVLELAGGAEQPVRGEVEGVGVVGPMSRLTGWIWMIEYGVTAGRLERPRHDHEREPADEEHQRRGGAVREPPPGRRPDRDGQQSRGTNGWRISAQEKCACSVRPGSSPRSKPPDQRASAATHERQQRHHGDQGEGPEPAGPACAPSR